MENPNELTACPFCDGTGEHEGQGQAVELLAGRLPEDERDMVRPKAGNTVCAHCSGVGDIHPNDLAKLHQRLKGG